jgi:hypothetical protein
MKHFGISFCRAVNPGAPGSRILRIGMFHQAIVTRIEVIGAVIAIG